MHMPGSARTTVYVVDDDDAVRDSLKILLESFLLSVRDFGSAAAFLDGFESSGDDCLLLDLHLPAIGGFEILSILEKRGVFLPVIVLTGRGDEQAKARAFAAGAVAFLEKPVDEVQLMAAIDCARRGGRALRTPRTSNGT
jgi:two-component system response regulator FixJ